MPKLFPLAAAPKCSLCGASAIRKIIATSNRSGNAGRPYYSCQHSHSFVFITWDDDRNVEPGNPRCYCSLPSRYNTRNDSKAMPWYACATSVCRYKEDVETEDAESVAGRAELGGSSPPSYAWTGSSQRTLYSETSSRSNVSSPSRSGQNQHAFNTPLAPTPNMDILVQTMNSMSRGGQATKVSIVIETPVDAKETTSSKTRCRGKFMCRIRCRCGKAD
jgi:hypothetical protein